jgi:hypothetical protein
MGRAVLTVRASDHKSADDDSAHGPAGSGRSRDSDEREHLEMLTLTACESRLKSVMHKWNFQHSQKALQWPENMPRRPHTAIQNAVLGAPKTPAIFAL